MKRLILAALLMCGAVVQAQDETPEPENAMNNPVLWLDGVKLMHVSCFWMTQFPNRNLAGGRFLLVATPAAVWTTLAKRSAITNLFNNMLTGSQRVDQATINALKGSVNNNKFFLSVTDNPKQQLATWGLVVKP